MPLVLPHHAPCPCTYNTHLFRDGFGEGSVADAAAVGHVDVIDGGGAHQAGDGAAREKRVLQHATQQRPDVIIVGRRGRGHGWW